MLNAFFEHGVVSAAQDQGVYLLLLQGGQITTQNHLGFPLIQPTLFHQGYQQRARSRKNQEIGSFSLDQLFINPAANRGPGADHSDPSLGAEPDRLLYRRTDHLKQW